MSHFVSPSPLRLGNKITILPVIHGSAECALVVRRWMLDHQPDCIAIPLPPSFQEAVLEAVQRLPSPSIVLATPEPTYQTHWTPDHGSESEAEGHPWSYVPIDPCQSVIAAIRGAAGEHIPIRFIDRELRNYEPWSISVPDPYALKTVSLDRFATAVLPSLQRPEEESVVHSIQHMANQLHELESQFSNIVFICSIAMWPWLREAYHEPTDDLPSMDEVDEPRILEVETRSLLFMLGEMPFITGLYEKARFELEDDENLSIDGIKQLLLSARARYQQEMGGRGRRITTQLLSRCLQYIRNLTLMDRQFTPELATVATATQQILGDQYTIHVIETANQYAFGQPESVEVIKMGIDQGRLPDGSIISLVSRLPGVPRTWKTLKLTRRPDRSESNKWRTRWNSMRQCSWPPEDKQIESFRTRVFDRARAIMGADLARSEKFSTSFKDGIDIRETLRHWYDGEIYVKVLPPSVGMVDATVMLFDSPADPREYPWRSTWFAEHEEESTLAFFATDFRDEFLGPGVALAMYGGAMFLFPPRRIPDIWNDPRLDFTETLEERLIAATCLHAESKQVALLSRLPPGAGWRRLAKRFRKTLVHVPLSHFSSDTVQQLRMFHVLNGAEVRSYAANFIRKA